MSLNKLPQVDKILNLECFKTAIKPILANIIRDELEKQRELLKQGKDMLEFDKLTQLILQKYENFINKGLKRLINATGVVMHTNLARSVIDEQILSRAKDVITSYSNLEYNLNSGQRGNRYDYIGSLLSSLFGFEDALVVNNNASAVFLILNTFAKGGETIVSRGELVEIGGSFRVPDVMSASGSILKEVGTTNKTHLYDYENAINESTKMLLKVHRSNFDIVGFTQSVDISEISKLAKDRNLIEYYDLGSGYVGELNYNLGKDEPSIAKFSKVSLVSFSGDKLFGSVQAGIILGKRELIAKLRKNALLRMLRVDKVTLAILSESVKAYLNKEFELITTIKHINKELSSLENLANLINQNLKTPLEIVKTNTFVGGGSLPNKTYPSIALKVAGEAILNESIYRAEGIIGRIENEAFLLDLRSILDKDVKELIEKIDKIESAK
ncbi:L-seryl-tRNA(Sec) selenium transferase [Campylobacter mucosalis]|uniref:L-seryl-tRNA(Sec) selenium transferase n=1 Tax=Campylobacter mucosalis TaxID=202 RepID=UPI00146FDAF0|nr:L-seryl-tRNA(Sec) selenium transferase [Campylobacter mucosalis]